MAPGGAVVLAVDGGCERDDRIDVGGRNGQHRRDLADRHKPVGDLLGDIPMLCAARSQLVDVHRCVTQCLVEIVAGEAVHALELCEDIICLYSHGLCHLHPLGVDCLGHPGDAGGDAVGLGAVRTHRLDP